MCKSRKGISLFEAFALFNRIIKTKNWCLWAPVCPIFKLIYICFLWSKDSTILDFGWLCFNILRNKWWSLLLFRNGCTMLSNILIYWLGQWHIVFFFTVHNWWTQISCQLNSVSYFERNKYNRIASFGNC